MDLPQAFRINGKMAALLSVACLLAYLGWQSIQLQVDYFDSFSILKTAKGLSDGNMIDYNWRKAPLMSIILAPFISLENTFAINGMAHLFGRFLSLSCLAVVIYLTFRMIALYLQRCYAWAGALLLAANPMFIHHAPFSKDDLLGAALASLAVYFYARCYQDFKLSKAIMCALAAGLALTARYNFLPTLTLFFFAAEVLHWVQFRSSAAEAFKRCLIFVCLPFVVFFGLHGALYHHLNVASFTQIPMKLIENLSRSYELMATGEAPIKNYIYLGSTMSWPVLALFVAGVLSVFAKKDKAYIPFGLWILIYFVFHTYFVDHKEARYLMPIFPAIYFFVALGLRRLLEFLQKLRLSRINVALITLLVLILPLKNAIIESARFLDPFYKVDFEEQVSRYADELAAGNKVVWVGPHYPLVPKDYVFDIQDDFWNMFHFAAHVVYFYTGKDVVPVLAQPLAFSGSPYIFVPLILQFAGDGDVLIINREVEDYRISNLPARLKPLYVQKVSALTFERSSVAGEFRLNQSGTEGTGPKLNLNSVDGKHDWIASGLPDGAYEFYVKAEGETQAAHVNFIFVKEGRFTIVMTDGRSWDSIKEVTLLTFSDGAAFSHPTYPAE